MKGFAAPSLLAVSLYGVQRVHADVPAHPRLVMTRPDVVIGLCPATDPEVLADLAAWRTKNGR